MKRAIQGGKCARRIKWEIVQRWVQTKPATIILINGMKT